MKFLEELKTDLDTMSSESTMITVKRENLEVLIRQYEKLKKEVENN